MTLNLLLNFLLIPHFKSIGAAYSSLITQFITAVIQIMLAQKLFRFKLNYRLIISLAFFIVGAVLLGWAIKQAEINWMLGISVFLFSGGLYAFATGIIHIKSIFRILKYG